MKLKVQLVIVAAVFLLGGCGERGLIGMGSRATGWETVLKADILFRNGNYSGALLEYERYLNTEGREFADEALFRAAAIQFFYLEKPGRIEKASENLRKVVEDFPDSPRRPEAELFLKILDSIHGLKKENLKLKADLKKILDLDIQLEEKRKALH